MAMGSMPVADTRHMGKRLSSENENTAPQKQPLN